MWRLVLFLFRGLATVNDNDRPSAPTSFVLVSIAQLEGPALAAGAKKSKELGEEELSRMEQSAGSGWLLLMFLSFSRSRPRGDCCSPVVERTNDAAEST